MADIDKRPWWETFSGVLKAAAAAVAALGTILVTLNQLGLVELPRRGSNAAPGRLDAAPANGGSNPASGGANPVSGAPSPGPAGPATDYSAVAAPAGGGEPEETQVDITGYWRDATGTVYEMRQAAGNFQFRAANQVNGSYSAGGGTIRGRSVEGWFETSLPSRGRTSGTLSSDGRQITGRVYDSVLGEYVLTLYR